MKEVLEIQKRFMNSCERIQLDGPTQVADVLDKLIDSLINKWGSFLFIRQINFVKNVNNLIIVIAGLQQHSTNYRIFKWRCVIMTIG